MRSLVCGVLTTLVVSACAAATGGEGGSDAWFPELAGNLTRITWAHAVNDRLYLQSALASDVLMLEADVVLGHVVGSAAQEPVMAHPPATTSDLSLRDFLAAVDAHNRRSPDSRKGVKLDFKSIEAFEASESSIAPISGSEMRYSVWLNADILPGPVESDATPVDADRFLRLAGAFPRATLSVGWTTRLGGDTGVCSGSYTAQHAADMTRVLRAHRVSQPVTFPVRAGLAATVESRATLRGLLAELPTATLTLWGSAGDPVDVPTLRALVLETGLDRVYLDLPADLAASLHLPPPSTI